MRVVCIADTHKHEGKLKVPEGDLLIVAGDFCFDGILPEVGGFARWLKRLPHTHKVVIAGNHDKVFQKNPHLAEAEFPADIHYLYERTVEVEGLKIYGAPWTPTFQDWSFMRDRGEDIRKHWDRIPNDTDILVTHGPPLGVLDMNYEGKQCGCEDLLEAVLRVRPKLHVFGHIHDHHGVERFQDDHGKIVFVNAAQCGRSLGFGLIHEPIVIDLDEE